MKSKIVARDKRHAKTRYRISKQTKTRLLVYKTANHIYAQLTTPKGDSTMAVISSLDPDLKKDLAGKPGIEVAKLIGSKMAERAISLGCKTVAFDRAGFKYHGRIKALADAARQAGLDF